MTCTCRVKWTVMNTLSIPYTQKNNNHACLKSYDSQTKEKHTKKHSKTWKRIEMKTEDCSITI